MAGFVARDNSEYVAGRGGNTHPYAAYVELPIWFSGGYQTRTSVQSLRSDTSTTS